MGRGDEIVAMLEDRSPRWLIFCGLVILAGCGLYGASVGLWRSPLQSVFTGIKIPLLIFLTCAGNALLNGILAQMIGSGLGFRQASAAILLGFTVAACLLAACCPLGFFVLWNTPPLSSRCSWWVSRPWRGSFPSRPTRSS